MPLLRTFFANWSLELFIYCKVLCVNHSQYCIYIFIMVSWCHDKFLYSWKIYSKTEEEELRHVCLSINAFLCFQENFILCIFLINFYMVSSQQCISKFIAWLSEFFISPLSSTLTVNSKIIIINKKVKGAVGA